MLFLSRWMKSAIKVISKLCSYVARFKNTTYTVTVRRKTLNMKPNLRATQTCKCSLQLSNTTLSFNDL